MGAARVPRGTGELLGASGKAGSLLPGARQGLPQGEERQRLLLRGLAVLLQPVRPKLQVQSYGPLPTPGLNGEGDGIAAEENCGRRPTVNLRYRRRKRLLS